MATNKLGADYGYKTIILGGPTELEKYYTQIRKIKDSVVVSPGLFVSGNGETEGEIDLAAAGDGLASFIEIVLYEVNESAIIVDGSADIDRTITGADASPKFVKTLRQSGVGGGGFFHVVCIRADESSDTELGEPMALEATGHCKSFVYGNATGATDLVADWVGRCANVTTDEAGDDISQEIFF